MHDNRCLDKYEIPAIALRGLVILPNVTIHFDVARQKSLDALHEAINTNQRFFAVTQKSITVENPDIDDLYSIGTVVEIKQIVKMPNDTSRIMVRGLSRASLNSIVESEPFFVCEVCDIKEGYEKNDLSVAALKRMVLDLFDTYLHLNPRLTPDTLSALKETEDAGVLCDLIASNIILDTADRQSILELYEIDKRFEKLIALLKHEIELLTLEHQINDKLKSRIDKNQRDYFLREQLKVIKNELGDDDTGDDMEEYKQKIKDAKLSDAALEKCNKELKRLMKMNENSPEAGVIRTYLDTILELPWNKKTKESVSLKNAKRILDRDHFGLEKVKERVIEHLAVKLLKKDSKGSILCLVGPPGVGKTSIAKSVAEALNRKYARISLGGMRDEADIRGHRRTYIGSMPGRIISAMRTAGAKNAFLLLDEIDKVGRDFKGDPAAALLEVLDYEQNTGFVDHYLELPFDLSNVMFMTTANTLDTIPRPLLDRMEIIEISGYTEDEKVGIAKKYLIPKQAEKHGIGEFKIDDGAIREMIRFYTRESGVRSLERTVAALCRKRAKELALGENTDKVKVLRKDVAKYLGIKKYTHDRMQEKDEVGVATGLAWTSVGGEILYIEVLAVEGTGKINVTGSLGDVMKESANAALSYTRSKADELNIKKDFYRKCDIHIHVPDGATPKDGPSAGITMATSLISALTGIAVKKDVAMTGEISLRGRVLPIGGLKEKVLAAYRAGIRQIVIPKDNEKDLEEIPASVKDKLRFVLAEHMDTVIKTALAVKPTIGGLCEQNTAPVSFRTKDIDMINHQDIIEQ